MTDKTPPIPEGKAMVHPSYLWEGMKVYVDGGIVRRRTRKERLYRGALVTCAAGNHARVDVKGVERWYRLDELFVLEDKGSTRESESRG